MICLLFVSGLFLEQFAKLGLFQKVHSLSEGAETDECSIQDETGVIAENTGPKEDAKEILAGRGLFLRFLSQIGYKTVTKLLQHCFKTVSKQSQIFHKTVIY